MMEMNDSRVKPSTMWYDWMKTRHRLKEFRDKNPNFKTPALSSK